jgi:hypothetical protein
MKPPRTQEEIEELAERLIEAAGSKRAAHRFIDAAKARGDAGRPARQLAFRQAEVQLLSLAGQLRWEWVRHRPEISRSALISKIVTLCWDDSAVKGRRRGGWNVKMCRLLALPARLGQNPDAVVARVLARRWRPDAGLPWEFVPGTSSGPWIYSVVRGEPTSFYYPPHGLWEALHRARPDLQLLPPSDDK